MISSCFKKSEELLLHYSNYQCCGAESGHNGHLLVFTLVGTYSLLEGHCQEHYATFARLLLSIEKQWAPDCSI